MIASQRHLFDIPHDVAYINCGYMAPSLHSVVAAGEGGVRVKTRPWQILAEDFFTDTERARALFARVINASPDDVAIVPSVSYGIATAARNLPVGPGQRIVMLAEQFPSNVYSWRALADQVGAELVTVARPDDGDWTSAVLAAIDERTALASLPHCHWTDGSLVDLVEIGRHCRTHGAALVADLAQSCGAMPFDAAEIQPDFAVAPGYKWLLGPYGLGFLYVSPRWHGGTPIEHNWIARKDSQNFSGLVNYVDDYQPGARRYDMGERTSFHLMPMAIAALEQILDWQVADIAATLSARTSAIAERARAVGLLSSPAEQRAGHFLGLRFPHGVPGNLRAQLAEYRVYVSVRGDSMRVTPHVYNTDDDVDRLFQALAEVRG